MTGRAIYVKFSRCILNFGLNCNTRPQTFQSAEHIHSEYIHTGASSLQQTLSSRMRTSFPNFYFDKGHSSKL